MADEQGLPLKFRITAGQAGEYAPAAELLAGQQAEAVIVDPGYDADILLTQSESIGARAVIPRNTTANSGEITIVNSTSSATASNAASTSSSTSADSLPATAKPSRSLDPSPLSLAPGSDSS